jgi:hypothetical protein
MEPLVQLIQVLGVKDVLPRQFNAIIEAANRIITELERDYTPVAPGCGLAAWLASDDTGMSSKWMARQMFDAAPDDGYAHPHDADDFARCMTFVAAVPESDQCLTAWQARRQYGPRLWPSGTRSAT